MLVNKENLISPPRLRNQHQLLFAEKKLKLRDHGTLQSTELCLINALLAHTDHVPRPEADWGNGGQYRSRAAQLSS
jgi:hypothetical protein